MTQLTFTEEEVKKTAAFVQFVYDKATFNNMSVSDCMAVTRHMQHMNSHIKVMDQNIMEFRKKIPAPDAVKKKKTTTKKKSS